jgi:hypothetical protein
MAKKRPRVIFWLQVLFVPVGTFEFETVISMTKLHAVHDLNGADVDAPIAIEYL